MTGRVALVTDARHPALSLDDQLLLPELSALGLQGMPVAWDTPGADWAGFAAVVVRSTWDYHIRYAEFLAWLSHLDAVAAPVSNPVATLRWNSDKSYIRQLDAASIPVVPTEWASQGRGEPLSTLARRRGWEDLVVKPTVSGGAFGTWRVTAPVTEGDDVRFAAACRERDMMVQPFQSAIAVHGEYSLVFFRGAFSHAVQKRPAAGDFRVQEDVGGSTVAVDVDGSLVDQAARALAAAPTPCLYARVDGYLVRKQFVVMELELLEPSLFLSHAPHAAGRFAHSVQHHVTRQRAPGRVASSPGTSPTSTSR
jgi:glutathione synthase/RimK-type ligase-like ATP-grasp enzyme